jgi:hypothetical protein
LHSQRPKSFAIYFNLNSREYRVIFISTFFCNEIISAFIPLGDFEVFLERNIFFTFEIEIVFETENLKKVEEGFKMETKTQRILIHVLQN